MILILACGQAYGHQTSSRNACNIGCNKMFVIQSKAPYIHGWLVYMGASGNFVFVLIKYLLSIDFIFHKKIEVWS